MHPAFRRAYLLRGAVVWMGLRAAMAVGQVVRSHLVTQVALMGLVAGIVALDASLRREALFLANVGRSRLGTALWGGAAAVACEGVLMLLLP